MAKWRDIRSLAQFPYVVVRIGCNLCHDRAGQYRLARLAEKYGADTPLETVLDRIAADCPHRGANRRRKNTKYVADCHAHFPDIETLNPRPPDLPAALSRPRLIKGGKV